MEKQQKYQKIRESLDDFLVSYSPKIDNLGIMATLNSLVKTFFPDIIFVGFYLVTLVQNRKVLEIGPYQGNVLACARIEMGDGVCGIAAEKKEVQIVSNVFDFPGYIACDAETKSEIVIPVIKDGEVVAVFDLDHGEIGYFEQVDQENLENLLSYLD